MNLSNPLLRAGLFFCLLSSFKINILRKKTLMACSFLAFAMHPLLCNNVTFNLLDQNGALIPASQFIILTSPPQTVAQSQTVSLSPGTYTVKIFPGFDGQTQSNVLHREETFVVSNFNQILNFEWATASLTFDLSDQHGDPIPASRFRFLRGPGGSAFGATYTYGSTLVLPITQDAAHPNIFGLSKDGYSVLSFPGILGNTQGQSLIREEQPHELPIGGGVIDYEWETAPLTLGLNDQYGDPIPASRFRFLRGPGGSPFGPTINFPATFTLPITEESSSSVLSGMLKDGYAVMSLPGFQGNIQNELVKEEPLVELVAGGISFDHEWIMSIGSIYIVDDNENEVCGAKFFQSDLGTVFSGDEVSIPVTDESIYPTLFGSYTDGFPGFQIEVLPFSQSGMFNFEFLFGNIVTPTFITIDGNQFGLRFDLTAAQQADADKDGFCKSDDCNDTDPSINPAAEEICGNNLDDDCNGEIDEGCGPPLEVNAGDCQAVYYGYAPEECTDLTAVASNGSPPYSFEWANGETTSTINVCPTVTTTYSVTVTDANNNQATGEVTVEVVDVHCGNNGNKVLICHNGNNTLCISENAVPAHLNNHGDYLGPCGTEPCNTNPNNLIVHNSGSVSSASVMHSHFEEDGLVLEKGFELFPNPTSNYVQIYWERYVGKEVDLIITNALGKVAHHEHFDRVEEHLHSVELPQLFFKNGIYLVTIISPEQRQTRRLVIAHQ